MRETTSDTTIPTETIDLTVPRCFWAGRDPEMILYHDTEWGVPCHDDRELFERLMLEGFQAGLSWSTILKKRDNFFRAFDGWQPEVIANYGDAEYERLMADAGIVRNRLKVRAATQNAQAFLRIRDEIGSFDRYLWNWVDGEPLRDPAGRQAATIPASTPLSDALSKDLKKRGFTFVGTTIVYAFMQSVGMVDDHTVECFRYAGG
jgi:DNA-3-methyladenine glycosylase I